MIWLSLLKNNWKLIAVASIALVIFIRVQIIKSERDNALATIAEMRQEAIKQSARVELLKLQGKQAVDVLNANHLADIQHIGSLYGKVINDDKASINNYRTQLANSLRAKAGDSLSTLSNNDTDRPAENNGNAADFRPLEESAEFYKSAYIGQREYIKTLEQAGSIAASDYNTCKDYVDGEQSRIGVSD